MSNRSTSALRAGTTRTSARRGPPAAQPISEGASSVPAELPPTLRMSLAAERELVTHLSASRSAAGEVDQHTVGVRHVQDEHPGELLSGAEFARGKLLLLRQARVRG